MHELAIAESIVDTAVTCAGGRRVRKVCVKIGRLRQVVPAALTFSFGLVAAESGLPGAELEIEDVAAIGRCPRCRAETELLAFPLACGRCGETNLEIARGQELLLEAIEFEA